MKKIIVKTLLIFAMIIPLTGCTKKDAIKFKESYESINNTSNKDGLLHRTLTIPKDNPFIYSSAEEVIKKIENKDTFYIYFGSTYCPWCRSVIEEFISAAKENNIKEVYYVDIWKSDHEEILRDKYELDENNKPKLVSEVNENYQTLLKYLDKVLADYTLTTKDNKKVNVGEKRIFAPNFIYIKDGEAIKNIEGISDKQKDAREQLSEEIKNDEKEIFNEFFKN